MSGWGEFIAAFAAFLLSHALPARPALRRRLAAAVGERGYLALYSLVSLAILAWLVAAAGRAPYVGLWTMEPWQYWAPNLAMPLVCLLVAFGVGAPNPLSFGGHAAGFDPAHPGIAGLARHPLLIAIALWAAAHIVPNGNLAHLLLFGSFAGLALLGMTAIDRRKQRQLGGAEWAALAARTSLWPGAALLSGRWRPSSPPSPVRLAAALLLWLVLLMLHRPVIGVSPLPP
ncbi:NnrU family protein [Muricoccus pecuniae]|uniref:Putative membrane protein n=1 Tax=Muricoccus pecuniae TaxID=693023 RepID=A0A840YCY6_9PROT|nr:NnrU family protein [Roseomonas pecuniae]MBB5692372.1 putative membrane protein [Roseomonas pecuniae]